MLSSKLIWHVGWETAALEMTFRQITEKVEEAICHDGRVNHNNKSCNLKTNNRGKVGEKWGRHSVVVLGFLLTWFNNSSYRSTLLYINNVCNMLHWHANTTATYICVNLLWRHAANTHPIPEASTEGTERKSQLIRYSHRLSWLNLLQSARTGREQTRNP